MSEVRRFLTHPDDEVECVCCGTERPSGVMEFHAMPGDEPGWRCKSRLACSFRKHNPEGGR